jgi:hypothetical protein
MLALDQRDGLLAGARAQDVVARPLELAADRRSQVELVVDDENLCHQRGSTAITSAGTSEEG